MPTLGVNANFVDTTPSAPQTFSFNNSEAGSNQLLVVAIFGESSSSTDVSAVTYGGDSLTKIGSHAIDADNGLSLWYRIAPKTGTNDISVSWTSGAPDDCCGCIAAVVTDAAQTSPIDVSSSLKHAQFGSWDLTTTVDNTMFFLAIANDPSKNDSWSFDSPLASGGDNKVAVKTEGGDWQAAIVTVADQGTAASESYSGSQSNPEGSTAVFCAIKPFAGTQREFDGTAAAASGSSADAEVARGLDGTAAGVSGSSADLSVAREFDATAAGVSSASADLTAAGTVTFDGTAAGVSGGSADMARAADLVGTAAGVSGATGFKRLVLKFSVRAQSPP